jgi:hypothetical protein
VVAVTCDCGGGDVLQLASIAAGMALGKKSNVANLGVGKIKHLLSGRAAAEYGDYKVKVDTKNKVEAMEKTMAVARNRQHERSTATLVGRLDALETSVFSFSPNSTCFISTAQPLESVPP